MKLQVLVSTMNQPDYDLLVRMNISSDAIIINQCGTVSFDKWEHYGRSIQWYNFSERGIGLSRNTALMRATGDILLFADDDISYVDHYAELIEQEFANHPFADLIIFNLKSTNPLRAEYQNTDFHRLHFFNCLRYGTSRIAVKRERVLKSNIAFSLLFGGGARYGCGEDTLFLVESLKRGLKIYASPLEIGTVSHKESTWFSEYNKTFFHDKGALFACISSAFAELLCLQFCIRHKEMLTSFTFKEAYSIMRDGIKEFKNRRGSL